MVQLSRTGKPICSCCRSLASYAIRVTSGDQVAYSYQCVKHRYASSRLLTAVHIDALTLDHGFYHRYLFRAYLVAHPDVTVGCSADEGQCPLAHFYSLYYEQPCRVTFSGQVRTIEGNHLLCYLSAWARTFVLALDFTHPDVSITGSDALVLLHRVSTVDQVVHRAVSLYEDTDRNAPTLLSVD